jgi:hypothetical protein
MADKPAPPDKCKPSHRDEYETLREEIMLYQHEIHRTWLWAIITAGAIYTWLASHRMDINVSSKSVVWLPPFLLFVCALRYFSFRFRIRLIARYLLELEEDAFGRENNPALHGFGHYTSKMWLFGFSKGDCFSYLGTLILWIILISWSCFLSCSLSKIPIN